MIPQHRLDSLLRLAEAARQDRSLLPNHRGTVDKDLTREREEIADLLDRLAGDQSDTDLIAELTSKLAAINHALTAYAH